MTENHLTIWTPLHGNRRFEKVRVEQWQTKRDGPITVSIWRSPCVICSAPFEVGVASLDPVTILLNGKFETVTCHAHRLTPSERGRLSGHNQRQVLEQIKAAKLGQSPQVSASDK